MQLFFKFGLWVHDVESGDGITFHRWLPDDEKDAISIPSSLPVRQLLVWLPRKEARIPELQPKPVDPALISRQSRLSAKGLLGSFETVASKPLLKVLTDGQDQGLTDYVEFAKAVVTSLQRSLDEFLELIQIRYGQYWVRSIGEWDSRSQSLGNYTRNLELKWSTDKSSWQPFNPTKSAITLPGIFHRIDTFQQFLTKSDWEQIPTLLVSATGSKMPEALLITSARRLFEEGELSHAVVEAITALEVAVDKIAADTVRGTAYAKKIQSFFQLPLLARAVLCLGLRGGLAEEDMKTLDRGIELRNAFAHEGKPVQAKDVPELRKLFKVLASLAPGTLQKSPSRNVGNMVLGPTIPQVKDNE